MAGPRPYPEVQQGLEEKISPRNYTEEETLRSCSFVLIVAIFFFFSPGLLSSSRMRGSILCSLFLWIPAYAGMTGESLRNPVPELVEGCPRTFVILAWVGIHSLLSFRVFPCSSVAYSSSCPIVADASGSEPAFLPLRGKNDLLLLKTLTAKYAKEGKSNGTSVLFPCHSVAMSYSFRCSFLAKWHSPADLHPPLDKADGGRPFGKLRGQI